MWSLTTCQVHNQQFFADLVSLSPIFIVDLPSPFTVHGDFQRSARLAQFFDSGQSVEMGLRLLLRTELRFSSPALEAATKVVFPNL
jgi:hypothetical protein